MNILTAKQIREADAFTIAHEPISSKDLMERAALACTEWLIENVGDASLFVIICGKGNNGGDGLAIGRRLTNRGYQIKTYLTEELKEADELDISLYGNEKIIVIDAILGSGLSKPVEGKLAEIIRKINSWYLPVVSIDMPSGLAMDDNRDFDKKNIIRATITLTFETPKLSFMFADNAENVGEFYMLDIGLDKQFLAEQKTNNFWLTREMVSSILKPRARFSHKGTYGHALLIAGSYGKIGAAVLGARACLRSGAGLLTAHVPKCGYNIVQTSVPEAMVQTDEEENEFSGIKDISKYNAIGIGPGIGVSENSAKGLKMLIQDAIVPMVLDADALNIISENKTWLSFLKPGTIITPHPGEFARLAGKSTSAYEAYLWQREFAMKYRIYVVLKGAYTSIATPEGNVYFNSTGNPGMATGGSGDTLTGIILGLLAQGYSPLNASLLGVYIHGLAGDIAAAEMGENTLIAEDITNHLGMAFLDTFAHPKKD